MCILSLLYKSVRPLIPCITCETSQFLDQCFILCFSISEDTLILKPVQAKILLFHVTEKSRDKFGFQENWIKDAIIILSLPLDSAFLCSDFILREILPTEHCESFTLIFYSTVNLVERVLLPFICPVKFRRLNDKPGVSHVLILKPFTVDSTCAALIRCACINPTQSHRWSAALGVFLMEIENLLLENSK